MGEKNAPAKIWVTPTRETFENATWDRGDFYEDDNSCPNCGGEGIVYSCFEEFACIDPEGGCDLCERRCDWCRPARSNRGEEDNG